MENTMLNQNNVIDVDLSVTRKKRIRLDNDDNRIIELNTADMGIIQRLEQLADKMAELSETVSKLKYDDDLKEVPNTSEISEAITKMDIEMCNIVDDLFQSEVAKVCADGGTMFDMFNGQYRYEIIIEKLLNLYADNIVSETDKIKQRISKHTAKYFPKDHIKKG